MKFIHTLLTLSPKAISMGFIMAGLYNLVGILGFTQFFTDPTLRNTDPLVFSWLSQIGIILWGVAYLSQTKNYRYNPILISVFCIEKMLYAFAWVLWLVKSGDMLGALFQQSSMIGLFFAIYGLGDFLFGVFFGIIVWRIIRGDFKRKKNLENKA